MKNSGKNNFVSKMETSLPIELMKCTYTQSTNKETILDGAR